MLIRHLIVAALAASACAAHADVVPVASSTGTSSILSGWTGANGADVLSSGVLSGNLSLIGGISYADAAKSSGANGTTLADVLYGKASASVAQTADGQTQLFYKQGIEGMYLLGSGHGILAAMLGDGVSVVGSANGVTVSQGKGGTGSGLSGGGAQVGGSGGGDTGGGGSTGSTGSTGGGGGGGGGTGGGSTGGTGGSTGGSTGSIAGTGTTGSTAGGSGGSGGGALVPGPADNTPLGLDVVPDANTNAVPEPSSIALMMAGLLGAGGLARRRRS
ncbi:PEP-CTERM sorting domain-containing protein [Massilia terrae]|uniref:PEP-CTERM sorting domain-containing protein n=1 Tax=Massilia terrae TaxID=1811224 RepID=A0ABT2CUW5_9BURK|nr:PEP-CTERM sorting domain-containing protein [Massilia terrae]MCS0657634.1 PEP-CTERM sorting domain-containing protein [Massilia terrae]